VVTDEITNSQTPSQYLEKHGLTRKLARLGVTEEQLQSMRFSPSSEGFPFDQWTVQRRGDIPSEANPLVKAYCALKWLILENPEDSRDTDDAWRLVSEAMAAPLVAMGLRTKDAQSKRAKNPRGKINKGEVTIGQLIERLALQPQYRSDTAKDLWPRFFAVLSEHELYPKEIEDPSSLSKYAYEYDFGDGQKKITFRRFANIVSRARAAKSR
jgi:hypothetical protein